MFAFLFEMGDAIMKQNMYFWMSSLVLIVLCSQAAAQQVVKVGGYDFPPFVEEKNEHYSGKNRERT